MLDIAICSESNWHDGNRVFFPVMLSSLEVETGSDEIERLVYQGINLSGRTIFFPRKEILFLNLM